MDDCIIIGAGPAGLTAAIYLARFHLSIRLFDCGSSRAALIPCTHNHAGYPEGIRGTDLLARMLAQAETYGAVREGARVDAIEVDDDGFTVRLGDRRARARSILLATGVVNNRPAMPDAVHDAALEAGLFRYCPICDGYEVTDKRVGVIGTGDRGRTLIQNINKTRNCAVVSICDTYAPNLAKARQWVGPTTRVFSDHRAMLDAGGIDAVVIATPLNMHAHHTFDAFDAGLHVWCEKAMARTIADCGAMVTRSKTANKVLQIGHQRMFHPTYLNALKRAKAGEIGSLTQIRASWHRNNEIGRASCRERV